MKNGRIYGNTATSLNLTKLAHYMYNATDPCDIMECEDENGLYYQIRTDNITGFTGHYTEEEVNEYLESLADDDMEMTLNAEDESKWGSEAFNGMVLTLGDIKYFAGEWGKPVDELMKDISL